MTTDSPGEIPAHRAGDRIRLAARPRDDPESRAALLDALGRGELKAGGRFWQAARDRLGAICGAPCVALTTSGTAALEIGALALGLRTGSEVVVPSFTFVTTASAFARCGAVLRFADIDPRTLTLDPASAADRVTARTRAIVAAHYAGVACDMDGLTRLAASTGAVLVEDNAHGLGGTLQGRPLGSWGRFAALSFDWAKNVSCGEGGAIISSDAELTRRIEVICDRGANRQEFLRGERDRYEWVSLGTNSDLPELSAAILSMELGRHEADQRRRREVLKRHNSALESWAKANAVRLPWIPDGCSPACHIYFLLLPEPACVPRFVSHMERRNIESAFHYQPLHLSPFGRALGGREGECPVTEDAARRLVRIPCHHRLSQPDLDRIYSAVTEFAV